jgi:hypothetical protein
MLRSAEAFPHAPSEVLRHHYPPSCENHRLAPIVKIALEHEGDVGFRAGRILLGDRRVSTIGLIGLSPADTHQGRVEEAKDLTDYDLLVTDSTEPRLSIERALAADISCVSWVETDASEFSPSGDTTLLIGANLASGIAPCLASHEVARAHEAQAVLVAWTEPGRPLRSGEPLAFPEPIGGRWGRRYGPRANLQFVAPVAGEWAGAVTKVTSRENGSSVTRIVGVADLAVHLEALALAAGALSAGSPSFDSGVVAAADADTAYLAEALGVGLDVAAYTLHGT